VKFRIQIKKLFLILCICVVYLVDRTGSCESEVVVVVYYLTAVVDAGDVAVGPHLLWR
jgi:hypothetical protein